MTAWFLKIKRRIHLWVQGQGNIIHYILYTIKLQPLVAKLETCNTFAVMCKNKTTQKMYKNNLQYATGKKKKKEQNPSDN